MARARPADPQAGRTAPLPLRWEDPQARLGEVGGVEGAGGAGEGSALHWVLGKAMTSRMFSSPTSSAISRSTPKDEAGVGRRPGAERVEQEPEPGLLLADAEQPEDPGLDVRTVDPDRPEPDDHE